MRTMFKNRGRRTRLAAAATRDRGVTTWEARMDVVCSALDKAAILGLISYAVAMFVRIAEIV